MYRATSATISVFGYPSRHHPDVPPSRCRLGSNDPQTPPRFQRRCGCPRTSWCSCLCTVTNHSLFATYRLYVIQLIMLYSFVLAFTHASVCRTICLDFDSIAWIILAWCLLALVTLAIFNPLHSQYVDVRGPSRSHGSAQASGRTPRVSTCISTTYHCCLVVLLAFEWALRILLGQYSAREFPMLYNEFAVAHIVTGLLFPCVVTLCLFCPATSTRAGGPHHRSQLQVSTHSNHRTTRSRSHEAVLHEWKILLPYYFLLFCLLTLTMLTEMVHTFLPSWVTTVGSTASILASSPASPEWEHAASNSTGPDVLDPPYQISLLGRMWVTTPGAHSFRDVYWTVSHVVWVTLVAMDLTHGLPRRWFFRNNHAICACAARAQVHARERVHAAADESLPVCVVQHVLTFGTVTRRLDHLVH